MFLIISIIFGILIAIVTPPFQGPDEYNHFFRAYAVSEGKIIPKKINESSVKNYYSNFLGTNEEASDFVVGTYLPEDIIEVAKNVSSDIPGKASNKQNVSELLKYLNYTSDSKNKIFTSYPNTALYSPIPYLPSALGILISKILGLSVLKTFYVARIFNLISYLLLIYYAIKITPVMKFPLYLLALMPTSLFLAAVVSADSLVVALSFLVFSLVFRLYSQPGNKLLFLLILSSFLLGLSKSAYFLIPFSSLILLKKTVDNTNSQFSNYKINGLLLKIFKLLPSFFSVIGLLLWTFLSKDLYIPLKNDINPETQLSFVLNNPFIFFQTFVITFIGNRDNIVNQFVGNLGWLDTPINLYISYFYLFSVVLSCLVSNKISETYIKIYYIILSALTSLLVAIMVYLSWTPVAFPEILLAGRYFIPVSIFGLLLFNLNTPLKWKRNLQLGFLLLPLVILPYTLCILLIRYYVF